jgi:hypothetical protein
MHDSSSLNLFNQKAKIMIFASTLALPACSSVEGLRYTTCENITHLGFPFQSPQVSLGEVTFEASLNLPGFTTSSPDKECHYIMTYIQHIKASERRMDASNLFTTYLFVQEYEALYTASQKDLEKRKEFNLMKRLLDDNGIKIVDLRDRLARSNFTIHETSQGRFVSFIDPESGRLVSISSSGVLTIAGPSEIQGPTP